MFLKERNEIQSRQSSRSSQSGSRKLLPGTVVFGCGCWEQGEAREGFSCHHLGEKKTLKVTKKGMKCKLSCQNIPEHVTKNSGVNK